MPGAHPLQNIQVRVRELVTDGLRHLAVRVLRHPLLGQGHGVDEALDRLRIRLHIAAVGKIRGIRNLAAFLADGAQDIPLPRLLHLGGGGLKQGHIVPVAAGEGPGHHVELHRGVHHRVPLGLNAPLPQHIFQGHLRHAAGPAPDDGPAPDVLPGEGPRLPAHQEGAVPLGQLGKDHGMVLLALVHHIDGGLRACQAHVRLTGHHGGHDLVGAAAVGQLHLQPLLAEEALAHGHILRRVEHRVGDLAQAHPGQLFFPGAARQNQQRRQTKTQYNTDFFHALTPQ